MSSIPFHGPIGGVRLQQQRSGLKTYDVNTDGVFDLFFANYKPTDIVGHQHNIDSDEMGDVLEAQDADLGRLVRVQGIAESGVRRNSLWVRTSDGYRILVRFEPEPGEEALSGIGAGSTVTFDGYLQNIALAEFRQIVGVPGEQAADRNHAPDGRDRRRDGPGSVSARPRRW